ncbi:MAG: hypothetical protein J3K34DRAFT_438748 [Monoraphidium minutum]|nr:MAG: hypothetical protein J3K34DRAFT_438748 [Monoraphidium minutum]
MGEAAERRRATGQQPGESPGLESGGKGRAQAPRARPHHGAARGAAAPRAGKSNSGERRAAGAGVRARRRAVLFMLPWMAGGGGTARGRAPQSSLAPRSCVGAGHDACGGARAHQVRRGGYSARGWWKKAPLRAGHACRATAEAVPALEVPGAPQRARAQAQQGGALRRRDALGPHRLGLPHARSQVGRHKLVSIEDAAAAGEAAAAAAPRRPDRARH